MMMFLQAENSLYPFYTDAEPHNQQLYHASVSADDGDKISVLKQL